MNFSDFPEIDRVLHYFEKISAIPHGSGNTSAIADYIAAFAAERGLEYFKDEYNNVVIRKPATEGLCDRPTVILQGHTDMVIATNEQCRIDPMREGLRLYRDGDFLRAEGTTLGGDDGIAVAYALALLEARDIPHPALEVVLTSDEETGLDGAFGLDKSRLFGRLLINVDSDVEGVFIAGCAGGLRADVKYAARDERIKLNGGYKLSVSGLQGGHSGVMINEGRLNANRLLFEVLSRTGGVQLSYITGGSADNVIPRTAECVFTTSAARADIEDVICAVLAEARGLEPSALIELFDIHGDTDYFSAEDSERFIGMLCEMPLGVIAMCRDIPTLVETSLNMGILSSDAGSLSMTYSIRSAVAKEKHALYGRLCDIATKYGAKISSHGDYPGWEYRRDSHLRDVFCKAHRELYGKDAEVVIIHAGLECGIFSEAIEGLDCISLGPTNYDIHTADERLSISSTARVWRLILKVLSEI